MKKVAYMIQSWHIGGIETAIYNICNKLKKNFEFHFIATENPNIHPRYNKIGKAHYFGNNWNKITEYLEQNKIDILQWGNVSKYKECGLKANVPTIIERIAGPRSVNTDHDNITHMVCSSNGIVPVVRKSYSGPITVIKNGVEIINNPNKNRFNFDKNDFIVVYPAARMGDGQAYDHLILATTAANKVNPRIKLVLMGDRPNQKGYPNIKPKLVKLAKPLGNSCIFTGFVENASPIIAGANVCVVPAKTHGISNALIEAASYGIPLIASDVGQTNEICIDKHNGFLFKFGDTNTLKNYILKLSQEKEICNKMGQNGIELVKVNFDIDKQASKYLKLYNSF